MKLRKAFISAAAAATMTATLAQAANPDRPPGRPDAADRISSAWTLSASPLISYEALGGLGLLYGGACVLALRRRMKGAWFRAGAGGAFALVLLNPQVRKEEYKALPTEIAVVVDKSLSQSFGDRKETTEAARAALLGRLEKMDGVRVRLVEAETAKDGNAAGGTALFTALDAALADVPRERLGAVVMLTDGQVHDIPDSTTALRGGAPLHALVSGQDGEKDRRVAVDSAPRFGLVGKPRTIRFHIADEGGAAAAKEPVNVEILVDGKPAANRQAVPGEQAEAEIPVAHAGANVVEIRVAPLPGELTAANNRAAVRIEGIRENLRVLLVSGRPNADDRMIRNLLKSDPDNDLVQFTILRTPEKYSNAPAWETSLVEFPTHELFHKKIAKFDLIVFSHYTEDTILLPMYHENIVKYVKNGGALLAIAGPEYNGKDSLYNTPLKDILPAAPSMPAAPAPYLPRVTEAGQRHPVTRGLDKATPPWGRWISLAGVDKKSGETLMDGPEGKPLLILDRKEKGRVAMLLTDNTWLWERGFEGGGPHAELLQRLSHWLMKTPALEEEALRIDVRGDSLSIERQSMTADRDGPGPVTVRTPSGASVSAAMTAAGPGLWRVSVPAPEYGLYAAEQPRKAGSPSLTALTNAGPAGALEFSSVVSTLDLLKPVAQKTGGSIARMTDSQGRPVTPKILLREGSGKMAGPGWIGARQTGAAVLQSASSAPLLPPWLSFALATGALAAAWCRESGLKFPGKTGAAPGMKKP